MDAKQHCHQLATKIHEFVCTEFAAENLNVVITAVEYALIFLCHQDSEVAANLCTQKLTEFHAAMLVAMSESVTVN